jgi:hypothetical protein
LINIYNSKNEKIGYVDCLGWFFNQKKLVLYKENGTEQWFINLHISIANLQVEISNGVEVIRIKKKTFGVDLKEVLNDEIENKFIVEIQGDVENDYFMCFVMILVREIREFDRKTG